jgi:nitroimidazol reductase NimA-like FMN-containing flavoprotein (pyridoxamine 5'-phosphate oxidase superfamily)
VDGAMQEKIVAILSGASEMTIATVRPDGYPQATTVSYVHDGMTIYFGTAADSRRPAISPSATRSRSP